MFNLFTLPTISRFAIAALTVICALSASSAHAAVGGASLVFTGGNNSPLTITLNAPLRYTITTASTGVNPYFLFDEVGNVLAGGSTTVTGSLVYSVNNGADNTINMIRSGFVGGGTTANDVSVYNSAAAFNFSVNDIVVLKSGTFTTSSNVAATKPNNNSYVTFMTNSAGTQISSFGVVVPEANTAALLGLALPMIGAVTVVRRRKA